MRTKGAKDKALREAKSADIHKLDKETYTFTCPTCPYQVRTGSRMGAILEKKAHTH